MARGEDGPETGDMAVDQRKRATRIRASALRRAVKELMTIVPSKATIPIVNNVHLAAGDGKIVLTATNFDVWVIRTLASDDRSGKDDAAWVQSIRPFAITLPGKALGDVLAGIDGDAMVTIELADDDSRATIRAGRARFKLVTLPVEDFPPIPGGEWGAGEFEIPCSRLADAIAAVEHAISTEETRYYLNGIYLHPADLDLRLATTDGHRLCRLTLDPPEGGLSFPASIVGRVTVGLLDKVLAAAAKTTEGKDVEPARAWVEFSGETVPLMRISMPAPDEGEIEIVTKTIDGTFPDYQRVIPAETAHCAVIARGPLGDAIARVTALGDAKTRVVKAGFAKDVVRLSCRNPDLGEASEELPCDYAGPDLEIGFNGIFWRAALDAIASDSIAMKFNDDPAAPVVLTAQIDGQAGGPLLQVLMPYRV